MLYKKFINMGKYIIVLITTTKTDRRSRKETNKARLYIYI